MKYIGVNFHISLVICSVVKCFADIVIRQFITGPPNGPALFCSLVSAVVVCNIAGGRAGQAHRQSGG